MTATRPAPPDFRTFEGPAAPPTLESPNSVGEGEAARRSCCSCPRRWRPGSRCSRSSTSACARRSGASAPSSTCCSASGRCAWSAAAWRWPARSPSHAWSWAWCWPAWSPGSRSPDTGSGASCWRCHWPYRPMWPRSPGCRCSPDSAASPGRRSSSRCAATRTCTCRSSRRWSGSTPRWRRSPARSGGVRCGRSPRSPCGTAARRRWPVGSSWRCTSCRTSARWRCCGTTSSPASSTPRTGRASTARRPRSSAACWSSSRSRSCGRRAARGAARRTRASAPARRGARPEPYRASGPSRRWPSAWPSPGSPSECRSARWRTG